MAAGAATISRRPWSCSRVTWSSTAPNSHATRVACPRTIPATALFVPHVSPSVLFYVTSHLPCSSEPYPIVHHYFLICIVVMSIWLIHKRIGILSLKWTFFSLIIYVIKKTKQSFIWYFLLYCWYFRTTYLLIFIIYRPIDLWCKMYMVKFMILKTM